MCQSVKKNDEVFSVLMLAQTGEDFVKEVCSMKVVRSFCTMLAGAILMSVLPVSAQQTRIALYEGEITAAAWECPLTIPVYDDTLYTEGCTVAVDCDAQEHPYLALTSTSGGEAWAQLLPDSVEGDVRYYSYAAMADAFGTDFSLLDYVSVMAGNSSITVRSITLLTDAVIEEPPVSEPVTHDSRVVGYLPDWSYHAYRNLDFTALTHMNIAFCMPDTQGNLSCNIPDSEMQNIVSRAHNADVRVLAALGGGGGCDNYLPLIDTPEEMAQFNEKIIAYCQKYDLDGIDLDIELGSSHAIWNYYGDWVDALRVLCDANGYELTTATAQWVAVHVTPETYAKFDFVNVMAYDNDSSKTTHAGMDFALSSLEFFHETKKIPKDKLVLGVPFYGRGYTADGALDWNSYVPFSDLIAENPENYTADFTNGIAYNGAPTMREKCALGKEHGGIMIWELSQDARGEYSLLAVIRDELTTPLAAGDVNADGVCNVMDVIMLQKYLLRAGTLTVPSAAELCQDGRIDAFDLAWMKKMLLSA